jgi:hypothetical protein
MARLKLMDLMLPRVLKREILNRVEATDETFWSFRFFFRCRALRRAERAYERDFILGTVSNDPTVSYPT